ncbi:MAG: HAD-IA family hydrolase [Bacteroidales bacterium]|jgi:putative hydrolase of the HAD superfamily|nr:HAD-IA family hydrolase [Bacteroidales bacterium]
MKEYNFYLFDIDRTLWDFEKNAEHAIGSIFDDYDLPSVISADKKEFFHKYEEYNNKLWRLLDKDEITKEKLKESRYFLTLEYFFLHKHAKGAYDASMSDILAALRTLSDKALYGKFPRLEMLKGLAVEIDAEYMERMKTESALIPGARYLLEELKSCGKKTAVVSNGFKEAQYFKLKNSGIIDLVDSITVSEEAGCKKPNPDIFARALEKLCGKESFEKNEDAIKRSSLMAGDDYINDIKGAGDYGIDQFYFDPEGKAEGKSTYRSGCLCDILDFQNRHCS